MRTFNLSHIRRHTVLVAAGLAMAMGVMALLGWALQLDILKSLIPGAVQMKPNTAVCLCLSAAALFMGVRRHDEKMRYWGYALAAAVSAIGAATLCEYLFAADLRIDELLFRDEADVYNPAPGRMSPFSAWIFFMLGIGLGFVRCRHAGWLAYVCGGQVASIGAVSLLGYLWRASELVTDVWLPPVAVNTALASTALGLAVIAAHSRDTSLSGIETELSLLEIKVMLAMAGTLVVLVASAGYTYRSVVAFTEHADHMAASQQQRVEALKASLARVQRVTADTLPASPGAALPAGHGEAGDSVASRVLFAEVSLLGREIENAEQLLQREQAGALEKGRSTMLVSLIVTIGLAVVVFVVLMASLRREMSQNILARAEISALNEHLEQRVHERAAELNAANERMNTFMSLLAHDLRQPLISLGGFGELLDRRLAQADDAQGRKLMQRIMRAMKQVNAFADALLELESVSGRSLWIQTVDVTGLVKAMVKQLREQEPGRRVRLFAKPTRLARADRSLLAVVVWHVVGNSWKFTSTRDVSEIEVGCGQDEFGVPMWWIRDNGVGFDMAYADKLFMPFQRLHAVDEFPGLGTGLAIVHAVVARHGGRVWAHSEPGRGATFFFTLADPGLQARG
jgi:signal transduction histidine kinase